MKKCIVIPDSFKGTLSAIEICEVFKAQLSRFQPGCQVQAVPVADGGEGTVDCFLYALPQCIKVPVDSTGPYGEPVKAYYGRMGDTAILETAMFAGLPQVEGRADPAATTTFGLGTAMARAVQDGCKEILLGLGGSCTNDGGCGMAAALGASFWNGAGEPFVPTGATMKDIARIDVSGAKKLLDGVAVNAMCDVENPLYGPKGAAYVFGPQKGADAAMVERLDEGLRHLGGLIRSQLGVDADSMPGTGAAGGLGAGILAFLGGGLKSGISAVLDLIGFDAMLQGADMVFTGEGRIDSQSLDGKVISGIAKAAKARNVPVTCVVGSIGDGVDGAYDMGVSAIFSINRRAEAFETARFKSRENLAGTVADLLRFGAAWRA